MRRDKIANEAARREMTEIAKLQGWKECAARCMRRSRERVGSLNSLVHSRALRFGFPVCMRACPSVRPFVFAFVTRADASLAPTKRRWGLSARKKNGKKKGKRETARAKLWKRVREEEENEKGRSVDKISEWTRKLEKEWQAARTSLARIHKS